MNIKMTEYPEYICVDCGWKYGKDPNPDRTSTFHMGICDICKKEECVTQPRDFGHLKAGWDK